MNSPRDLLVTLSQLKWQQAAKTDIDVSDSVWLITLLWFLKSVLNTCRVISCVGRMQVTERVVKLV